MKNIIIFFSFFFILTNIALAEQKTIVPEMLSKKNSKAYKIINNSSIRLFKNIETSIDTSIYPQEYNNFILMKSTETQSPKFYYVKCNKAELLFDKETKKLKLISFENFDYPKSWIVYDYPSGNLKEIEIWLAKTQTYVFTPNGKFVNFNPYLKLVEKKVKSYCNLPNKARFANTYLTINLTINRDGNLKNYKIIKSSNSKEFDDSIIRAVINASPFSSFPDSFPDEELEIMLTFGIN